MNLTFLGHPIGTPAYIPPLTAWLRHGPFGMWLVQVMRPKVIVELGTHYGYSYFAFCQSVEEAGLPTRCFAVDTWQGDEHAGFYGQEVFDAVQSQNARYRPFSKLLRKTFAEALGDIEDGSVDLLHVDGRHFYDDVKEDFESWIPKLSDRAVVLFHDTEVRERGFGVWKYWEEISRQKPSFNFVHQHGLGVLFWGDRLSDDAERLRRCAESELGRDALAAIFGAAGEQLAAEADLKASKATAQRAIGAAMEHARDEIGAAMEDLHREVGLLSARNAQLSTALNRIEPILRNPVSNSLRRSSAKIVLRLAPFMSESNRSKLARSIEKRDWRVLLDIPDPDV